MRAPRGPIVVRGFDSSAPQEYRRGDMNPERIILNDANDPRSAFLPIADAGDRLTGPVRAVVDYSFGNFKFLVVNDPPLADRRLRPERTRKRDRDELAVASYNVENLDGADPQERFDRVADQIVGNLRSPDILSLEEIQDNDGAASAAPTQADVTHTRLLEAIVAAGGPPTTTGRSTPRPAATAASRAATSASRSCSAPTSRACASSTGRAGTRRLPPSRPPDRAAARGSRSALGGSIPTIRCSATAASRSRASSATAASRCSWSATTSAPRAATTPCSGASRSRAAERGARGTSGQAGVINQFVRGLLDIDPRARVVVLGDLNDFDFSETLRVVEEGTEPRAARSS